MQKNLGKLKQLEIRTQWASEAAEFTPWLAKEDNIALLGNELGIELEVESTEVAVGPYSADILARESASGDYVVIENQLGKTDHDHLGKAITYASVLDAAAIVWIASEFTEEHKKALDWLNDYSTEDISFFGVRVELWQIGDSSPAVRFNVISRPAGFASKSALASTGPLSEGKKLQFEWWTAFRTALLEAKVAPSAQTPRPAYWYRVALGRSGIHLSNIVSAHHNRIGVRVYMRNTANAEAALAQLLEEKEAIEHEIGHALEWDPNPDARDKIIAAFRDVELGDRTKWKESIDWQVDMTSRFRSAFSPRVKALDLETDEEIEIEE